MDDTAQPLTPERIDAAIDAEGLRLTAVGLRKLIERWSHLRTLPEPERIALLISWRCLQRGLFAQDVPHA